MAIPSYTDQQSDLMRKINGGYVSQASPDATAGVTMGAGNDMTLTNRMNAGAASMAASNQPNTLGSVQPESLLMTFSAVRVTRLATRKGANRIIKAC